DVCGIGDRARPHTSGWLVQAFALTLNVILMLPPADPSFFSGTYSWEISAKRMATVSSGSAVLPLAMPLSWTLEIMQSLSLISIVLWFFSFCLVMTCSVTSDTALFWAQYSARLGDEESSSLVMTNSRTS